VPTDAAVEIALVRLLAERAVDSRLGLGAGSSYLTQGVRSYFTLGQQPSPQQIMAAVWSVVRQGLAYIDYSQPSPNNWELTLTNAGRAAARDEYPNPDSVEEYLERLRTRAPSASQTVLQYTREAAMSYINRCFLASAVMLGVASEAAFLELAQSFGNWLPSGQREEFLKIVSGPRNYLVKFSEFRKRVEPIKPKLPDELSDAMSLTFDSVLDLLRVYRNDAGHPTGRLITRDDAFINLQMFARYVERLYSFKVFFDANPTG
jgi:hypothetical protein